MAVTTTAVAVIRTGPGQRHWSVGRRPPDGGRSLTSSRGRSALRTGRYRPRSRRAAGAAGSRHGRRPGSRCGLSGPDADAIADEVPTACGRCLRHRRRDQPVGSLVVVTVGPGMPAAEPAWRCRRRGTAVTRPRAPASPGLTLPGDDTPAGGARVRRFAAAAGLGLSLAERRCGLPGPKIVVRSCRLWPNRSPPSATSWHKLGNEGTDLLLTVLQRHGQRPHNVADHGRRRGGHPRAARRRSMDRTTSLAPSRAGARCRGPQDTGQQGHNGFRRWPGEEYANNAGWPDWRPPR